MFDCVQFVANAYMDAGAIALWNPKTQAWSVWVLFHQIRKATSSTTGIPVLLSHVSDANRRSPCEIYWDDSGRLRIRIMSLFDTGDYLDVAATGDWADDNLHWALITYDGSGTAAGVTVDADGVAASLTTIHDNLTGTTVPTQNLMVGNQWDDIDTFYMDYLSVLHLYDFKVNRAVFNANYNASAYPPPTDAYAAWWFGGPSGTMVVADRSGNGRPGTLSANNLQTNLPDAGAVSTGSSVSSVSSVSSNSSSSSSSSSQSSSSLSSSLSSVSSVSSASSVSSNSSSSSSGSSSSSHSSSSLSSSSSPSSESDTTISASSASSVSSVSSLSSQSSQSNSSISSASSSLSSLSSSSASSSSSSASESSASTEQIPRIKYPVRSTVLGVGFSSS